MSRFTETRTLACDADCAADLVLDWSQDGRWRSAVIDMTVEPGGRAVEGQQIVERLRFAGVTFVTPTRITSADRYSASFAGGSGVVEVTGTRTVSPVSATTCLVTLDVSVRLRGPLRPLTFLLAPGYRRQQAGDADQLAGLSRASGRAP